MVIYSLLHHSRINWGLIGSLVLGFVGVVVLLGPTIGPEEYMPAAIGIGGGMCMALATGFVKRLGTWREPDVRIIFYLMLCGTVVGLVGTLAGSGFSSWTVTRVLHSRSVHAHARLQPRQHGAHGGVAVQRHSL